MEWATGNDVTTELTGKIEHVALVGECPEKADLVLVAPATANTISKITCGIDDTTVTSVVSTAFGSRTPIIIVPAMHQSMYNHPVLTENIKKLEKLGVTFVGPRIEEAKAKIAGIEEIVQAVISRLAGKQDLSGFKVLITAGSTVEYIDPIRVITNRSSGKMGVAVAEEALTRGADVTLIYGVGRIKPPLGANVVCVETTDEMHNAVISELESKKYDAVVAVAAAADWTIEKPYSYKVSTHKINSLELKLKPTNKIIDQVKNISPKVFLVAFRAEYKVSKKKLIDSAYKRLLAAEADLIVVNDVGKKGAGFVSDTNEVYIVDRNRKAIHVPLAPKHEVARKIWDVIKHKLKPK
ncbi:MAG: bifunctional phosphopantothenoylcysteine decarboxylase/phosphopantothenate--cysteine ligase CoaBC, partial [Candidatus Bathyarchaeota archaeon]|jgi:phosphopantothenoylcysteine decarboxylase/phosphopantothenate--cysteine ligase